LAELKRFYKEPYGPFNSKPHEPQADPQTKRPFKINRGYLITGIVILVLLLCFVGKTVFYIFGVLWFGFASFFKILIGGIIESVNLAFVILVDVIRTAPGKKPIHCLEYIFVHELVHLLERQHNDRFLAYMDSFMPHWRINREELNKLPVSHVNCDY
jgi:hypothetical protein